MRISLRHSWGESIAFFRRARFALAMDLLLIVAVVGLVIGLKNVAGEWVGEHHPVTNIDLSPSALPAYTFFSLCRGLVAYGLSLAFTLIYGYWAAKDPYAEKILVPLLDILQSIPVLGFLPGLVLTLASLFPRSNFGLELAAVIMIFTGQAWNMTFSYYQSLRTVPSEMREVGRVFHFTWWQRMRWLEIPYATISLTWNSMMSMAGGWFFLMAAEAFQLGDRDFRLPGLGSYISVAVDKGDTLAMLYAVIAMAIMITALDQLLWRPVTVWAQKFRMDDGSFEEPMKSWFLNVLFGSRLVAWLRREARKRIEESRHASRALGILPRRVIAAAPAGEAATGAEASPAEKEARASRIGSIVSWVLLTALTAALLWGALQLFRLIALVPFKQWALILGAAAVTLLRVLASTAIGTLWTVPAGIAIGLSSRLSRVMQPVIQVVASFPAPMLFPIVIAVLSFIGIPLGWGAIVLMLMGTQWYILFNVIAGASSIPADLREVTRAYRFSKAERFWKIYLPAILPFLVTGWVTAAGGAWNASIVAEYVTFKSQPQVAFGLGAMISQAAAARPAPDYGALAACCVVMSFTVVAFNFSVWRKLYRLAETRFSLNR